MDSIIILCAKYLIFLVLVAALGYWLTLPRKQQVQVIVFGVITAIIAYILAKIGGSFFYDARPFVSDHVTALFKYTADNGFPSDHTLITASVAVTLFFVSKKWGIGFLIAAIIIGSSRVLAHVHHPVDIIGGLVFAGLGGLVAYYLTPLIMKSLTKSRYAKLLGLKTDVSAIHAVKE